jgi:alpha-tubulin suppressor-like RCC1 family protein
LRDDRSFHFVQRIMMSVTSKALISLYCILLLRVDGVTAQTFSDGGEHKCAILDDKSLKCWGSNDFGNIGDGTLQDKSTPTTISVGSGRTALAVSCGKQHTCAILDDDSVKCWGYNFEGQLGDGTTVDSG